LATIWLSQTFCHDANYNFIGNQLTGLHILFRLLTKGCPLFAGSPEHIASGDMGDLEMFFDQFCLGAFTCTRGA
jgi:hypothetical protein